MTDREIVQDCQRLIDNAIDHESRYIDAVNRDSRNAVLYFVGALLWISGSVLLILWRHL